MKNADEIDTCTSCDKQALSLITIGKHGTNTSFKICKECLEILKLVVDHCIEN